MISNLRRRSSALVRCAGALLALVVLSTVVAPAAGTPDATVPKIVSVDVTGNLHVPTATIMAVVGARPGENYDPKLVQDDLQRINALGYFASIAPPLVRARPDGIAITYRVVENPVISKILFNGNTKVPSDTLLALMDLSVGQVFNTNTFHQDVLKINNYYERIGYGGQVTTHVKDLNFDPASGILTLKILEGLTVRNIIIGGDPVLPAPIVLSAITLKPGMVYSDAIKDKDVEALKKYYEDKFKLELGNFEGSIDPSTIDQKNDTADVKYNVYVARVAAVQITGNTRTKDRVVRRLLRVRPGMVVETDWIKADYERLNATNYFSKVNPDIKEGPDPKKPQLVTLVWELTEQRTASASVGFGYQGGITGQGLYGTLGFSDNNLHGTGNSASIQFQRGARTSVAQISATIPYLGDSPKQERYSLTGNIFDNQSTYYYPVYSVGTATSTGPIGTTNPLIPVTLYPNTTSSEIGGVVATSQSNAVGASIGLGRRLSDYFTASIQPTIEQVKYSTTVPTPYYFEGSVAQPFAEATPNPFSSTIATNGSFGISATSIANVNTGLPYQLNLLTFGLGTSPITTDDPFNPRRGWNASFAETVSSTGFLRSSFDYTKTILNISRFFPVLRSATLAFHLNPQITSGVLPPSELYTFSDQQVRGYNTVFYATDALLGQAEFRQPLTSDRKITAVAFIDELDYRIRGAYPITDPYTGRTIGLPGDYTFVGDYGVGLRFDIPALGLRTVRIDFAKGAQGTHTSFGIGQSF